MRLNSRSSPALSLRKFETYWDWQQLLIIGVIVALVSYLAIVPILFLTVGSFMTPSVAGEPGHFTLNNYIKAYTDPRTLSLFRTSVLYAAGSSLVAFTFGTILAWMTERTNTPMRSLFYALSIVPLIIPGILFTISWIFLLSPEIGIINTTAKAFLSLKESPLNIYSLGGMIWVEGLHISSMAFLLMVAAFRSMDPALEESAQMSGASMWQTAYHVTLKLSWPAILGVILITFVRAIESFEVPALLGLPVRIEVFTSRIFRALRQYPVDYGLAGAYSITLLLLTVGGIYLISRINAQQYRYSTITGKSFRPRTIDLGPYKYVTMGLAMIYFGIVIVLPFSILLWSSLQPFYSVPSLEALSRVTLENYTYIINYPTAVRSVWNSFLLSVGSATAIMFLTAVVAWMVVKTKAPGRMLLDNIATLPIIMPGIVLGVSVMFVYLFLPVPIYGTIWILLVAYITRYLPYGMRYNSAAIIQIHKELEESAQMSGASWWQTFVKVVLPLLKPGLLGGWIYIVVVSIRELSSSILLYSKGSEVISIVIWELWENGMYTPLSALGVMFIVGLVVLVLVAHQLGGKFGLKD